MTSPKRGRPNPRLAELAQREVARLHALVYRLSGGRLGGRVMRSPVLVLVTAGRKTGKRRETPLLYLADGPDHVIVASNGGAAAHPAWYHNLTANPEAEVRVGNRSLAVRAETVEGEEKRRLWDLLVRMYPPYASYQRRTDRDIPVIKLRPVTRP